MTQDVITTARLPKRRQTPGLAGNEDMPSHFHGNFQGYTVQNSDISTAVLGALFGKDNLSSSCLDRVSRYI